ncbi:MAG: hypothetical protein JRN20_04500 [Nitrososphaerota archaeon]|nr:hypothetical protein [Nitrososphaerota archaeon]
MRLIVDTGRIIAALIRDSAARRILFSDKFEFLTVNFAKSEISEHEQEIVRKAKLSKTEFDSVLSLLLDHVKIVSDLLIDPKIGEARAIMHDIDPDDVPFIAAALAVENGVWTDDAHFKRQNVIRVYSTATLLEIISDLGS